MALLATLADLGPWQIAAVAVRAGLYAGVLVGVGSLLFSLLLGEPTTGVRRVVTAAGVTGAAVALVLMGLEWPLRAGFLGGGSLAAATNPRLLAIAVDGVFGQRLMLVSVGLAVVVAALIARRRWPRLAGSAGVGGALIAAAGFGIAGHTGASAPWLLGPVLMVHLLAAAYWIGALLPLHRVAGSPIEPGAAAILERFGELAVGILAALVVAGGALAYWLTGSIEALVTTGYGQSLLAKIALVAALLGLGALNKLRLVPAFARGAPQAAAQLRRSMRVEAGVAALVLAATAVLTTATSAPTV